ncbi:DUF5937 family protein [Kytococcus schroeteri]|uniref:DUF5937 family protein n=1 Tax=Kytococcus schroeteri TaxID=138300 RepID=UPI0011416D33|nr:DUF5937 family protein [Kytococcus schroeteri]
MAEHRLPPSDLSHTRFATSPLWETVASLRVLQAPAGGVHGGWAEAMRTRVREHGLDLSRLLALVPPRGQLADFLTPTPTGRHGRLEDELEVLRRSEPRLVVEDAQLLLRSAGQGSQGVLRAAAADPGAFREQVADDLHAYWELTVSRVWSRLEGLAEADIAWRLERMARGGTHAVLETLHPRVRMDGDTLVVANTCETPVSRLPGEVTGVVLVPCAFAWPDLLFVEFTGQARTLSYSPRGVGNLWRETPDARGSALADLVGRTRAAAVMLLDLPMTTGQLACHLDLTPPTASGHLKILERSGLVTARRRGRHVLYSRTPLGADLAEGAGAAVQGSTTA